MQIVSFKRRVIIISQFLQAIMKAETQKQSEELNRMQEQKPEDKQEQNNLHENSTQDTLDDELASKWNILNKSKSPQQLASGIKDYCVALVSSTDEQLFVNYFIQHKFLQFLHRKMKEYSHCGQLLRSAFSLLQFLLKALKKQEHLVFFLLKVSQEGLICQGELFKEQEDKPYFANFLKLMVRKINEDAKYITVFINKREPHFPLLMQLLKIYNCKDSVMRTSSQLAILEISNNKNSLLQKYLNNFPFALFYPHCVQRMHLNLKQTLVNENASQQLTSELKYMQQFLEGKERVAVDMYTNSFLSTIGRYIYSEMNSINEKNINKTIHLMKVLLNYVLPEISVVKIRTSLFCLLAPTISYKLKKCFETKISELDKYWIPQYCEMQVIEHCKTIYFNEQKQKASLFKVINSYIPKSKDNWLYYEIKKVSAMIGFDINLQEQINCDQYKKQSFLQALWSMIDDKTSPNQVFNNIMRSKSQELLYYYLRILCELSDSQNVQKNIELDRIVLNLSTSSSLALAQVFHNLVVKSKLRVQDSPVLEEIYERVTQKLVHFVLTKGWKELFVHAFQCRVPSYDREFSADIYREIQSQILMFVALRALLGTPNQECTRFKPQQWEIYPPSICETIVRCQDRSQQVNEMYLIFDGQFVNLKNKEEQILNKNELLIQQLQFLQDGGVIDIYGSDKCGNFWSTIHVDRNFNQFIMKEVKSRKEMANRVHLQLRQLLFQFKHK